MGEKIFFEQGMNDRGIRRTFPAMTSNFLIFSANIHFQEILANGLHALMVYNANGLHVDH